MKEHDACAQGIPETRPGVILFKPGEQMASQVDYPHIEKKAGKPACLSRVPRVRVSHIVMDYLAHGWSVDEMCRQHPYLTQAEAHAAMAYYWDHKAELDAEISKEWELADRDASDAALPAVAARLRSQVTGR